MINTVIFDMDGLMIDSERITFEGYIKKCEELGYNMTMDFYLTLLGNPAEEAYQKFRAHYGKDIPIEAIMKRVHQYIQDCFCQEGVPLKSGLIELLTYLKDNQYKTVVATSSTRDRVDWILELAGIKEFFDDIVCGDEVEKGKPNPDIFLKACEKVKAKHNEAIVLEDSETGILAASRAQIPCICVPDMKYPETEFVSKTIMVAKDLHRVKEFLQAKSVGCNL